MAFASAVVVTPIQLVDQQPVSVATLVAADGTHGNRFVASRKTLLRVKNASGAPITVTVNVDHSVHGLALPDLTFEVAATTGDVVWQGFEEIFDMNAQSEVHIEFSSATSVTLQVINPA